MRTRRPVRNVKKQYILNGWKIEGKNMKNRFMCLKRQPKTHWLN